MGSAEVLKRQLLIHGRFQDAASGASFKVSNPATNEVIAEVAKADGEDVERAVQSAHQVFESGSWSTMPATERGRLLYRVATLLRERSDELAALETRNGGKTITDAKDDVGAAAATFEYYAGIANKIGGQTLPVSAPGLQYTLREPVGVAALIVPWNFPLAIASWKLAPALAAGCTAVLKPASFTPLTALALGEICLEAGVPAGAVNVITGPGSTTGEALVTHPLVSKVAFTGETTTGQEILKLASATMKRVSLELGGKSPCLVFDDADIERAAKTTPYSVFANAGQDCCARSRVFVHRKVYEKFVEAYVEKAKSLVVGDPTDPSTEIGPLVSPGQLETVQGYVTAGTEEGAQLLCGGQKLEDEALAAGNFMAPAVFSGVNNDMKIAREEIFGPVASIIPFDNEDDAIKLANDTPFGLSGSIWTRDVARAHRVARRLRTGVMGINTNRSVFVEAPFGGFKMSGMGRDLGPHAMLNYTEVKSVYVELD